MSDNGDSSTPADHPEQDQPVEGGDMPEAGPGADRAEPNPLSDDDTTS